MPVICISGLLKRFSSMCKNTPLFMFVIQRPLTCLAFFYAPQRYTISISFVFFNLFSWQGYEDFNHAVTVFSPFVLVKGDLHSVLNYNRLAFFEFGFKDLVLTFGQTATAC